MTSRHKPSRWILRRIIPLLGPLVLRLLGATWRIEQIGREGHQQAIDRGRMIFAFWHQAQLVFVYTERGQGGRILISQHADGTQIARVVEAFGFGAVRGSTTRGGSAALRKMVRLGRAGQKLAITPDGPRGPPHRVQRGVITLARLTGLPIHIGSWYASRLWEWGTWDRFRVPKPFSRVVLIFSGPFEVPRKMTEAQEEEYRRELERNLQADLERAEAYFQR
ncbi:MAG: lysophospholipid acyltransferase family protein [Planctomycetota bacterium]|nr:lysophospholipid acyltransferase family protein [Planctomycetota bacterium]